MICLSSLYLFIRLMKSFSSGSSILPTMCSVGIVFPFSCCFQIPNPAIILSIPCQVCTSATHSRLVVCVEVGGGVLLTGILSKSTALEIQIVLQSNMLSCSENVAIRSTFRASILRNSLSTNNSAFHHKGACLYSWS